jgi:hypothetical protein
MLKILTFILTCLFFVIYHRGGLYHKIPAFKPIPATEAIPAPIPLPASKVIRTSQRTQDSERIVTGTSAKTKKTEYALSWAFQRRSLPEHEYFWMILGPLVLSLITITMCLMVYCHLRQILYREDKTTQEPSQPWMLHQWECVMLEMRGNAAENAKIEKTKCLPQKELN